MSVSDLKSKYIRFFTRLLYCEKYSDMLNNMMYATFKIILKIYLQNLGSFNSSYAIIFPRACIKTIVFTDYASDR